MSFDHRAYRYSEGRTCSQCPSTIVNTNKSGLCRDCVRSAVLADPAHRAARAEGIRRKYREDPEFRAAAQVRMRRIAQVAATDPVLTAQRRERGKFMFANYLNTPEVWAKVRASRAVVGQKITEFYLGWCPPDLRPKYKRLLKRRDMGAANARAVIEGEIADRAAQRYLDDAIRWLNRIAPTRKLESGMIRYGQGELRPGEVIDRARLKGWEPERLAA